MYRQLFYNCNILKIIIKFCDEFEKELLTGKTAKVNRILFKLI